MSRILAALICKKNVSITYAENPDLSLPLFRKKVKGELKQARQSFENAILLAVPEGIMPDAPMYITSS